MEFSKDEVTERRNDLNDGQSLEAVGQAEQFLQHALGTQGDIRVPAAALSLAMLLAVTVVAIRRLRYGRKRNWPADPNDEAEEEL